MPSSSSSPPSHKPLPNEIYDVIFSFVDEHDLLLNVALANKLFQRLAYRTYVSGTRDCHHPYGLSIDQTNRTSVLRVLRTAQHALDLPQLQYSFSYSKSDVRLHNEIIRLRGALRKRVQCGDRVGELVLEVSMVNSTLFSPGDGTLGDEDRESLNRVMAAFQDLFEDATRLCETLSICCSSSLEDTSSLNSAIPFAQPDGQVSELQESRSALAVLKSIIAQCFPQLTPVQPHTTRSSTAMTSIRPSSLISHQLSKAFPTVTHTLKIQSSLMLLLPPLLQWTSGLLRSPSVHTLCIHDTLVARASWTMLKLPLGANIKEVVIQGCELAFSDLCHLLQRCTDTLCSVIAIPSSPTPLSTSSTVRTEDFARLSLPKVTFMRLPPHWLDGLFDSSSSSNSFSQDLTLAGVNLTPPRSRDQGHENPLQAVDHRSRFPHLHEISIAVYVSGSTNTSTPSTITPHSTHASSSINIPAIAHTVGCILSSFGSSQPPRISLHISLQDTTDHTLVFPYHPSSLSTSSSPQMGVRQRLFSPHHPGARIGRPPRAHTRQGRFSHSHTLPSLSPTMIPLQPMTPRSPGSMSVMSASSLGLGLTMSGFASIDVIPTLMLSPPHPLPSTLSSTDTSSTTNTTPHVSTSANSHTPIASTSATGLGLGLGLHLGPGFGSLSPQPTIEQSLTSSTSTSSGSGLGYGSGSTHAHLLQGFTASDSLPGSHNSASSGSAANALAGSHGSHASHGSGSAMDRAVANAANLRYVRSVVVRAELYHLPEWLWYESCGFAAWLGRHFGEAGLGASVGVGEGRSAALSEDADRGLRSVCFVEWGYRDHPSLDELEALRKGNRKRATGAGNGTGTSAHATNDSSSTSVTLVSSPGAEDASDDESISSSRAPSRPQDHPQAGYPPRPPPFEHSNSHPTSIMLMNARSRAPFVRELRAQCPSLRSVRVGDCERSVDAWEALLEHR